MAKFKVGDEVCWGQNGLGTILSIDGQEAEVETSGDRQYSVIKVKKKLSNLRLRFDDLPLDKWTKLVKNAGGSIETDDKNPNADEARVRGKVVGRYFRDPKFRNYGWLELRPEQVHESCGLPPGKQLLNEPESCEEEFYTVQNYKSDDEVLKGIEEALSGRRVAEAAKNPVQVSDAVDEASSALLGFGLPSKFDRAVSVIRANMKSRQVDELVRKSQEIDRWLEEKSRELALILKYIKTEV